MSELLARYRELREGASHRVAIGRLAREVGQDDQTIARAIERAKFAEHRAAVEREQEERASFRRRGSTTSERPLPHLREAGECR